MEQEASEYGDESHIEIQGEIQGICVAVLRSRGGVLPFAMNCAYAEHQCSQIQHILPGIAPFNIGRTEGTVIDFLEESTPSAVSSKGCLAGWRRCRLPTGTDACGHRSPQHIPDVPGSMPDAPKLPAS